MRVDTADIILIAAYTIVVLVGVCGNSLVIHVVRTRRSMHSTMNFLLVNLAIADLLALVWCMPGTLLSYTTQPSGQAGSFLCKFITTHSLAGIGMIVSGLTLTLISVERYKALVRAMERPSRLNKGNVVYAIAAIWVFAIAYVIPLFVFMTYDEEGKRCLTMWPTSSGTGNANAYWILLAVIVTAAFITMFACYFSIIKGLYFTNTICGSDANTGGEADAIVKRRVVKMLLIVTVVFVLCFFPYAIATATNIPQETVFYKISYFLVYCSSSLNPITYAVGSANYRAAFKEVLKQVNLCKCVPESNERLRTDININICRGSNRKEVRMNFQSLLRDV